MNKNSKRLSIALLLLAAFIIAAAALRTAACLNDLEENLIYFNSSALITASGVVIVIGAVLAVALGAAMHKESLRASFSTPATYVPTGILASALALLSLVLIATYGALSRGELTTQTTIAANLALITSVLAPLSIAHLFLTAFITEGHTRIRAWFSLSTVAFLALYASFIYFGTAAPLNSHNKIIEEMAYLFAAIFFLYESRISLGREMWRPYIAFGMLAALISSYASIPAIAVYLVRGDLITSSLESAIFLLAISIFTTSRLALLISVSRDGISREMTVLAEFAAKRQDALDRPAIEDGTQISIEELIDMPHESPSDSENSPEATGLAESEIQESIDEA